MKLISLTSEINRSRHWQDFSVSLIRLAKTSLIHINSYSDGILDLEMLGYNMYND